MDQGSSSFIEPNVQESVHTQVDQFQIQEGGANNGEIDQSANALPPVDVGRGAWSYLAAATALEVSQIHMESS
ncbi:uncharacterized protein L201_004833 [Kwoniella dendrophila CBS 6074]|uniref:Uncharacterized protein n=1 Tax=Kwoniella dendrophila CBS 6074 TaxID=1295534 RepID=A0AAX4JYG9_9TREE